MTEIEKMKRYIERTRMSKEPKRAYQMSIAEMLDLAHASQDTPVDAIVMAFNYGCAKAHREAQAERRAAV